MIHFSLSFRNFVVFLIFFKCLYMFIIIIFYSVPVILVLVCIGISMFYSFNLSLL